MKKYILIVAIVFLVVSFIVGNLDVMNLSRADRFTVVFISCSACVLRFVVDYVRNEKQ